MSKSIDTLVSDIYDVVEQKGGWDSAVSEFFKEDIGSVLDERLRSPKEERKPGLRMSNLGSPCTRKLWYSIHKPEEGEPLPPYVRFKFLYGDILESVILSLAMAAGHKVKGMQDELIIGGIKGHRDAVIDGITVDVKSASPFSYKKFAEGGLQGDDPFGYVSQLSSYVYAGRDHEVESDPNIGAFLVVDKVHGHICLDKYDFTLECIGKEQDVERIKREANSPDVPPRSFDPIPEGKSGNMKLGVNCSYCDFKNVCHPKLRTFIYSRGPTFLTTVKKQPNVPEVT